MGVRWFLKQTHDHPTTLHKGRGAGTSVSVGIFSEFVVVMFERWCIIRTKRKKDGEIDEETCTRASVEAGTAKSSSRIEMR